MIESEWPSLDVILKVESTGVLVLMRYMRDVVKIDLRDLASSSSESGVIGIGSA